VARCALLAPSAERCECLGQLLTGFRAYSPISLALHRVAVHLPQPCLSLSDHAREPLRPSAAAGLQLAVPASLVPCLREHLYFRRL
jgi:hypothetical protein